MKKLILFLAFLTANTLLFAQLYEIPLDQKIDESQIIIEGKVVKNEPFIGNDDRIYTAHKVEIQRVLKGTDFRETHLTIVTRGGETDERITTWSHLLTLRKGETGVFFLQATSQPVPALRDFPSTNFEVFSSSQGFLKYTEDLYGRTAVSPFQKYENIESELVEPIALQTGETVKELDTGNNREEGKRCIIYTLEPINETALNPIKIGADIKVRSSQDSFDLFKSLVVVEYDTIFFGSNVASNGTIELYDGDISGMSNYNLTVTDLAANKVKIKLTSIGSVNQLFTVTGQKSFLARVYLQIANPFGTGIVSFDNDAMEQGNLYYDPSTSTTKPFDCIEIENEVFPSTCPIILSFNPPTAAAGVGQQSLNDPPIPGVITVVGENFGTPGVNEYKPPHIKLGFTNAGPSGADWCFPPVRDIISWSEDTIVVRVPSIDDDNDEKTYAGSGQLIIWNTDENCFSFSIQSLYVPFAVTNLTNLYTASQTRESILTKMENVNDEGGYDLYFGDDILTIDSVEQSFERALNTWRCTTKVNMVIKPKNEIVDLSKACLIDLDTTLPTGVITTLARTLRTPEKCNDNTHATQPKFDIFFSKYIQRTSDPAPVEINWYTSETPMSSSMDTFPNRDFQTVALHELGHASMLLHTKNSDNVMFTPHAGTKRALTFDDLDGGIHTVELSVIDPHCELKMTKYDCTTNSVFEVPKLEMNVFPNPSNTAVNLSFEEIFSGKVILFDAVGRQVISKEIKRQIKTELQVGSLPNGIYFLTVFGGYNHILNHSKIIKQ